MNLFKRKPSTCGKSVSADTLCQHNGRSVVSGSTEGWSGWATTQGEEVTCNIPPHDGVHIYSGDGFLVSWPWKDIGGGAGIWDRGDDVAKAFWATNEPTRSLREVMNTYSGVRSSSTGST